jgi:glutaryl-CoA dehydrogenase
VRNPCFVQPTGRFIVPYSPSSGEPCEVVECARSRCGQRSTICLKPAHRTFVENRLAFSRSFKDVARILTETLPGIAWHAVGHAMAAYEIALSYAKERIQFGKPLSSQLQGEGKLTDARASLAKMNNARLAREVVADAREMLGATEFCSNTRLLATTPVSRVCLRMKGPIQSNR